MNKIADYSVSGPLISEDYLPQEEEDSGIKHGGRSFYFFDFDDNIMRLNTDVYLFHIKEKYEVAISSQELSKNIEGIGKRGMFADFEFNFDDNVGSFRNFRDKYTNPILKKLLGNKETFIKDIKIALKKDDFLWKAPSWDYFYYACLNQRPISIITARGHSEETIKKGMKLLLKKKLIPKTPNYLSIFCVSNPQIRKIFLGKNKGAYSVSELKKTAIRRSVEKALEIYGRNEYHQFGMSDDDPKNVELITQEMMELKNKYPEIKFFVIQTYENYCVKREIFTDHYKDGPDEKQLQLF